MNGWVTSGGSPAPSWGLTVKVGCNCSPGRVTISERTSRRLLSPFVTLWACHHPHMSATLRSQNLWCTLQKGFLFNHTTLFSTKGLEKSLHGFTASNHFCSVVPCLLFVDGSAAVSAHAQQNDSPLASFTPDASDTLCKSMCAVLLHVHIDSCTVAMYPTSSVNPASHSSAMM